MKPAKEWAERIRDVLGKGLRYDPTTSPDDEKSVIELIIEQIQVDAKSENNNATNEKENLC